MQWKLADAKNKFSEVVTRALTEGPQHIARRDDAVVVLSERDFQKLTGKGKDFKQFLLSGPDLSKLNLTRDRVESIVAGDLFEGAATDCI